MSSIAPTRMALMMALAVQSVCSFQIAPTKPSAMRRLTPVGMATPTDEVEVMAVPEAFLNDRTPYLSDVSEY